MLNVPSRAYVRQPRTRRFLLLSMLLHVLAVVALNVALLPRQEVHPTQKQEPMRVSFVRPQSVEEPTKAEVLAEASSRAQTPEGPKAEVATDTDTVLPQEGQAVPKPAAEAPPQPREEAQPSEAPPPVRVVPKSPPEAAPKRPAAAARRQERAKAATQTPAHPQPTPPERADPERVAKLPQPAERTPPKPLLDGTTLGGPSLDATPQPEPGQPQLFGRIPLLSGDDLEKYAQVRTSDVRGSSGNAVSLDTKELKYLSYFAQIKRKIERIWTYPPDAAANGIQGQLYLKFVLNRSGEVKNVEFLRSSGYKVLDKEAWNAVINAGPFGGFPPTIPDDELHITARFTYAIDDMGRGTRVR
jgi:periplasmic protein TonB